MKKNVGKVDKIVRLALGLGFLVAAILIPAYWLLIFSAIAFVTAAVGYCGIYSLLGINTNKKKDE